MLKKIDSLNQEINQRFNIFNSLIDEIDTSIGFDKVVIPSDSNIKVRVESYK
jgi:hypothetical protein